MPGPVITAVGLADVQRFIAEAPKSLVVSGFAKALSASANVFADAVERLCPVKKEDTGGLLDQGVLREQIMVEIQIDSQFRGGRGIVGWGHSIPKNLPLWVERGHRVVVHGGTYTDNRGRLRKGTHVTDIKPHPFVSKAFDISVDRALEAFTASISQTISG